MKRLTIFLLTLLSVPNVIAEQIRPFTSDGCSAFPDGTIKQKTLWLACCYQHDKSYWAGGTADQRKQADFELKQCVADAGEPEIAQLMLAGVRVGGSPYYPTRFRWGYGWSYLRGYKPLSEAEKIQIQAVLEKN